MKWLSEYDNITTPESWIEDTLAKTVNADNKKKNDYRSNAGKRTNTSTGRMRPVKVLSFVSRAAVIVGVMAAVSTGTVYAYNYYKANYMMKNTADTLNHFGEAKDENGNDYIYTGGQEIKENAVSNQDAIKIEATNVVTETHKVVIRLNVRSTDGSPLVYNDEKLRSYAARQKFETIDIWAGGKKIEQTRATGAVIMRVDDAKTLSEAVFELYIRDEGTDFTNVPIDVKFTNYWDEWQISREIGFMYNNVAELAAKGKIAGQEALTAVETGKYSDGTSEYHYTLKPGNQKIKFSSEYPDAYIDNMAFGAGNGTRKSKDFYMTVVPGNNSDELKKLVFKNLTTGTHENISHWELLEDGRIQIQLSADFDRMYSKTNDGIYQDTTAQMLANYRMVIDNTAVEQSKGVRYKGTWEINIKPAAGAAVKTIELNDIKLPQESVSSYHIASIKSLKLTDTQFNAEFTFADGLGNDVRKKAFSDIYKSVIFVMKDGSRVSAGNKVGGGYSDTAMEMEMEIYLKNFIDTDNVAAIEVAGYSVEIK